MDILKIQCELNKERQEQVCVIICIVTITYASDNFDDFISM